MAEWQEWELNKQKIEKGYRKLQNSTQLYDYMFPTSHDIFPEIIDECLIVLEKILKAGNTVLITTKPDPYCIERICSELREYKDQITFRFTITSRHDDTLKKYEPNAPSFNQRCEALEYAFEEDYTTSLSIEPFLEGTPDVLINHLSQWVNDEIWLGIMSGSVPQELKEQKTYYFHTPHPIEMKSRGIYSKENLKEIIHNLRFNPNLKIEKVMLKDSIVNKLGLSSNQIKVEGPVPITRWIK